MLTDTHSSEISNLERKSHGGFDLFMCNVGNQRTNQTFLNGNYQKYTYDSIGELTSALGTEAAGTPNRLQEQLKYGYDFTRNLNTRTNNTLVETFSVNGL